jgi:coenzyme PQQ biosynthesis probable peptidase PqqF
MPVTADFPEYPVAAPACRRLGNGLSLALLSRPGAVKAGISVRVAAGSHDEPEEYPGLAHFLEHLLFLGSTGYAVEQSLMAFVQACGGQVNASTQARHTDYFCEVPADRLDEALARLLDMLANPLLARDAQLREREVVHAEFLARGQDADTLVAVALGQALPPGHRFAAFQAGNRETLAVEDSAFQQALQAFHRRFYQAGQLSLVLSGPQPVDELQALAERHGGGLPGQPPYKRTPPAPLLPLIGQPLCMTLPAGEPCVQLGFALELPLAGLDEALDFLQGCLLAESAGGLLAGLREAGLCAGLQVRSLYRHAEQALLLLGFTGVEEDPQTRAAIVDAVQDWLVFFAGAADSAQLRATYRAVQQCRQQSLEPLALARYWQDCLSGARNPLLGLTREGQDAVSAVLAQMGMAQRRIILFGGHRVLPNWPVEGFALRMALAPPLLASARTWQWQLPAANPLLDSRPVAARVCDAEAHWRWLPAPCTAGERRIGGAGMIYLRWCFVDAAPAAQLLAVAQAALRELQASAAEVAVALQLTAQDDGVQLSLQGPAALLPKVLERVLLQLPSPTPSALRQARQGPAQTEMLFRQLLRRLPELFVQPAAERATLTPERLQGLYRQARIEGLGMGLSAAGQAAIARLFIQLRPLPASSMPPAPSPGRQWLDAAIDSSESALLLFCPQPAADALSEAGWRMLAQLYQGAFFQRLRSELQLGYAVFCGFRQVQGQRGILFAVQSPHASADEILGHIETFLQAQGERLVMLDDASVARLAAELRGQLEVQASSLHEHVEQHWQQHLAGLPEQHAAALELALGALDRAGLLHFHRQLLQAEGGWRVLANAARPAAGWSLPG